ncbi:hypothetical protein RchiOBHm_Chr5g0044771 [Rosa chinensis]|uniref:Uncharacterized protein n=1 Tax=Rosa chinensis TaxID=74649 RepID=A0A2P6QDQ3_ROSCH|nr:hypothetical protein RchiOBHm_Chr5g0044771 [Rosa chinensis]
MTTQDLNYIYPLTTLLRETHNNRTTKQRQPFGLLSFPSFSIIFPLFFLFYFEI